MSDPFSLLVDAANAKSQEALKEASADDRRKTNEKTNPDRAAASEEKAAGQLGQAELLRRESLERELLEREALERELLQRRALMDLGFGGYSQDSQYMQQLRLEALVQQRRQETLAQLAMTQDMNPDYGALLQAQQSRQAALLRQEMLAYEGGLGNLSGLQLPLNERFSVESAGDESNILLEEQRRIERYEQQRRLANISGYASTSGASPEHVSSVPKKGNPPVALAVASAAQELLKGQPSSTIKVPCPARGLPPDHNAETAYFTIDLENIEHGAPLVCSYYACRNSGAQYKFCTTCNAPASKWNFAKLHKHEPTTLESHTILLRLIERGVKELDHVHSSMELTALKKKKKMSAAESKKRFGSRQGSWDDMLSIRPKDPEKLLDWVQQILAVSDIDTELSDCQQKLSPPSRSKPRKATKRPLPINRAQEKRKKSNLPVAAGNKPADTAHNAVAVT